MKITPNVKISSHPEENLAGSTPLPIRLSP